MTLRISDLLEQLQKAKEAHGDLPLVVDTEERGLRFASTADVAPLQAGESKGLTGYTFLHFQAYTEDSPTHLELTVI